MQVVAIQTDNLENGSRAKLWLMELRAPFLVGVIVPTFLGGIIAATEIGWEFNFGYFILTLIGIVCIHLGANISNDYYDFKSGADVDNPYRTPFSGGSGLLSDDGKLLRPRHVFMAAMVFYGIGAGIGITLDLLLNDHYHFVFLLGVFGVGLSFFYTAPPFRFSYRGLGELAVAVTFGPFVVVGAYYVQTVKFSVEPVLASLPLAALIMAILYINEVPDYFADKRAGKKHLVVKYGTRRAVDGYFAIVAFAYASIFFSMFVGLMGLLDFDGMPLAGLLVLVTLPIASKNIRLLEKKFDKPMDLVPANANTILLYTVVGAILCIAYLTRLLGVPF